MKSGKLLANFFLVYLSSLFLEVHSSKYQKNI